MTDGWIDAMMDLQVKMVTTTDLIDILKRNSVRFSEKSSFQERQMNQQAAGTWTCK